ncbi:hypothetical protein [Hufsiella ginkgonis]|uniref:YD repeat-containing protein n=1 Tax=Hufsiella ginkgonis TaxID=2695274 RepID=A0A7K1XSD4_9SPHI|nr:hypothetical protein [Hufsiella ginkgonis]MXV13921.1 hypothetical protein [Hufsiella ginkgonis]
MILRYVARMILLSITGVWVSSGARAQATLNPGLDLVTPPSPNVRAINKFGGIPVGLSTGIPSVSVPIYTWSGKNFGKSVPISIDYHAGGVKVNDAASNVGLGWALTAGGVVSRNVRGIYDEYPTEGFLYRTMPANTAAGNETSTPNNSRTLYRMNANVTDSQCDIFNYSFDGKSGRFVYGRSGDSLFLDQTKIRMTKRISTISSKSLISGFTGVDESGYIYVFQDYEISTNLTSPGYVSQYTSSWYLSRIYNPSKTDSIVFEYDNTSITDTFGPSGSQALPIGGTGEGEAYLSYGATTINVSGKRLKKITFPDGNVVDFYYSSTVRTDLPGDYLLQKVKISKGSVVFGYTLSHDYSISGRATLKTVTPIGGSSETTDKPYTFEYNTTYTIPARGTTTGDHWGYYNGPIHTFFHNEWIQDPGMSLGWRELGGSNRDSDPNYIKAGSMTKMTYPTGGYTVFELEANTAKDNWLNARDTITVNAPPTTAKNMYLGINSGNSPAGSQTFYFEGESSTNTKFEFKINHLQNTSCTTCSVVFEIRNPSNVLMGSQQVYFSDATTDPYYVTKTLTLGNLVKNTTYTIYAYTTNLTSYFEPAEINWTETGAGSTSQMVIGHTQPYVGGLRAKRILDYTGPDTDPAQIKEYEYTKDDNISTSGALGFRPTYSYLVHYENKTPVWTSEDPSYAGNIAFNFVVRSTSAVNDITYVNGSPVTYSRVVEKISNGSSSLGKTVRYFTNFGDAAPVILDVFPQVPVEYSPWYYGKLLREDIYNSSNQLIKKTVNAYEDKQDPAMTNPTRLEHFRSATVTAVKFSYPGIQYPNTTTIINPGGDPHYHLMSSFYPIAGRSELVETKVTEYASGFTNMETVTSYAYDADHYYLKETKLVNSRGQERRNILIYPKDRINALQDTAVYGPMYRRNMINTVVGEKQFLGTRQLIEQRKAFYNWSAGVYAPKEVYTRQGYNSEELRLRYSNYDTHGAVISAKQENGVPVCYVWGYGGEYLVAKITNVDYSSVSMALGGSTAIETFRNDKTPSDATVASFIAPLSSLTGAQVESFTWHTLLGQTSHTDVKGLKTYYEYDSFGRLINIKDRDGNIVKSYSYHYKD